LAAAIDPVIARGGRLGDGARIGAASKRNDLVAIEIFRVAPEPKVISSKFLTQKLRGIAFVNARTGGDFQINAAI
jgi:hypothetical protein